MTTKSFIIAKNYRVLKPIRRSLRCRSRFIIAKNYRVLKQITIGILLLCGFYHSEKLQSTKTHPSC